MRTPPRLLYYQSFLLFGVARAANLLVLLGEQVPFNAPAGEWQLRRAFAPNSPLEFYARCIKTRITAHRQIQALLMNFLFGLKAGKLKS
jgi:hypothetical protein